MPGKGTVVGISLIFPIREQTAVLGIQDEEQPVEKDEALLLGLPKVAGWIEVVWRVPDKTLDAKAQGFKDPVLQLLADGDGVLRAALNCPRQQRLAAVHRRKSGRTEQKIEAKKVVKLAAAGAKLKLVPCWRQSAEERRQIDFQIGLKAGLDGAEDARHEPPQTAIGQDAIVP
jgi:hypothetical protein